MIVYGDKLIQYVLRSDGMPLAAAALIGGQPSIVHWNGEVFSPYFAWSPITDNGSSSQDGPVSLDGEFSAHIARLYYDSESHDLRLPYINGYVECSINCLNTWTEASGAGLLLSERTSIPDYPDDGGFLGSLPDCVGVYVSGGPGDYWASVWVEGTRVFNASVDVDGYPRTRIGIAYSTNGDVWIRIVRNDGTTTEWLGGGDPSQHTSPIASFNMGYKQFFLAGSTKTLSGNGATIEVEKSIAPAPGGYVNVW